jgi:hypothetical protein
MVRFFLLRVSCLKTRLQFRSYYLTFHWKHSDYWLATVFLISVIFQADFFLVLGSARPAWDLLEKRSEIYSSRPRFVTACVSMLFTGLRQTLTPI